MGGGGHGRPGGGKVPVVEERRGEGGSVIRRDGRGGEGRPYGVRSFRCWDMPIPRCLKVLMLGLCCRKK